MYSMYYTFWNKSNPIFVFCCVLPSMRRYDHLHKYINWCPWVFPTKLSLLRNVRLNLNKSTNRKPVQFNPFLISGYFIASLNRLNCVTSLDDNFHSDSSPDRPGVPEQRAERCHDRHHEACLRMRSCAHNGGHGRRGGVLLAEADPGDGGDHPGGHRGAAREAARDEVQHDAAEGDTRQGRQGRFHQWWHSMQVMRWVHPARHRMSK